jgi:hypothetical protein
MASQNNERMLGNTQRNLYAFVPPVKPSVDPEMVKTEINAYITSVLKIFDEEIHIAEKLDKEKSEKEQQPISISDSRTKLIESKEKLKQMQTQNNITIQNFVKEVRAIYKVLSAEFIRLQKQRHSWFSSTTKNYEKYIAIYNRVLGGIYSGKMIYPIVLAEYKKLLREETESQNGGNRKSKRSKRSQSKTKRAYRKTRNIRRK